MIFSGYAERLSGSLYSDSGVLIQDMRTLESNPQAHLSPCTTQGMEV